MNEGSYLNAVLHECKQLYERREGAELKAREKTRYLSCNVSNN